MITRLPLFLCSVPLAAGYKRSLQRLQQMHLQLQSWQTNSIMQPSLTLLCLLSCVELSTQEMEIQPANNIHFRQVGEMAGTVATSHIIMSVNLTQHVELARQLCALPKKIETHANRSLTRSQVQLLTDLQVRCHSLQVELKERWKVWSNGFNKKAKREVDWCLNENPLLLIRDKRQALLGVVVATVVAAASALYSHAEIQRLSAKMHAQEEVNIELLQEHQTRLAINTRSIELLNSSLGRVGFELAGIEDKIETDELILHMGYTLEQYAHDSTRIIRGLNSLAMHRLSPDVVRTSEMSQALAQLKVKMLKEGYTLGLATFDDIFRCDTSHVVFRNGTMVVLLHLPAYKSSSKLKLYQFLPVPVIVEAPERAGSVALFAVPDREMLALTADSTAFKAFTKLDISACRQLGGMHFCPEANLFDRRTSQACVVGLYRRDHATITHMCKWKSVEVADYAFQLGPNRILLYQSLDSEVKMACGNREFSARVQGLKQILVPPRCILYTDSFTFEGQEEFSVALTVTLEKPINFTALLESLEFQPATMGDVMHDLGLVGSSAGLTIENIRRRFDEDSSSSGWLIGLLVVVLLLLLVVGAGGSLWLYLKCKRRQLKKENAVLTLKQYVPEAFSRRPQRQSRRLPAAAQPANRPLSAPTPPPACEAAALLGQVEGRRSSCYEVAEEDEEAIELRRRHGDLEARAREARRSQAQLQQDMILYRTET